MALLFSSTVDFLLSLSQGAALFIVALVVLLLLKYGLVARLHALSRKTENDIDDVMVDAVNLVGWPFYAVFALFVAAQGMTVPLAFRAGVRVAVLVVVAYYAARIASLLTDYLIRRGIKKGSNQTTLSALKKVITIIVWVIAVLVVIQNLGYDISALVAGLGIGGVAVAFALQNILGDVLASFSIHFDRPFEVGDLIVIGNDRGIVKKIGVKSTRIQMLEGQELVISNKELTESRVHNYHRLKKRRGVFTFGIVYETPLSHIKKISQWTADIINKQKLASANRVHFKRLGDSSLDFEAVYYVDTNDYKVYLDIQQKIYIALIEKFEKENISFAYPTRTVFSISK